MTGPWDHRLTVYLDPDDDAWVRAQAEKAGTSLSSVVVAAIQDARAVRPGEDRGPGSEVTEAELAELASLYKAL